LIGEIIDRHKCLTHENSISDELDFGKKKKEKQSK